jgi:hypothetical protein
MKETLKLYVKIVASYGAEIWIFWKVVEEYLESWKDG